MYAGERFNGYTHLAGAALALVGGIALIVAASLRADPWRIVAFSIYGASLVLLYLVSTLYHSTRGRAKDVFRKLDHCAIYVLIAGTYTPFTLVTLNGPWGWTLFGIVWGLALIGIIQEVTLAKGARVSSLVIYLLMGWLALVAVAPLITALSLEGLVWLAAGGAIYTTGIVFYIFDERYKHWHGIWHLFVLGGSAAHFGAVAIYVA